VALEHGPAQGYTFGARTHWVRNVLDIGAKYEPAVAAAAGAGQTVTKARALDAVLCHHSRANGEVAVRTVGVFRSRRAVAVQLAKLLNRDAELAARRLDLRDVRS